MKENNMIEIIRRILKEEFYNSSKMNYGDDSVTFEFKDMSVGKPFNGKRNVFFNKLRILNGSYLAGENSQVILKGNGLELEIPPEYFRLTKRKDSGFVDLNIIRKIKPSIVDSLFDDTSYSDNTSNDKVTSTLIRSALKIAFKPFWKERDTIFSPGLRDIHTIGEKTGGDETWSIMNFFDTKKEVQAKIQQKWEKEGKEDNLFQWLIKTFKEDETFLRELIEMQWRSIQNGYETELYVSKKLSDNIGGNTEFFPPGSIMDRYNSIDMVINGESYQVKPLSYVKEVIQQDGKKYYYVNTYGMREDYKRKDIDYIVYGSKGGKVYVFPNKKYYVKNRGEVLHFEEPKIY